MKITKSENSNVIADPTNVVSMESYEQGDYINPNISGFGYSIRKYDNMKITIPLTRIEGWNKIKVLIKLMVQNLV